MFYDFSLSLGQPSKGTNKVKAEIRLPMSEQDPSIDYYPITIEKPTRYVSHKCSSLTISNFTNVLSGNRFIPFFLNITFC